jgi:hypothetical protein
MLANDRDGLGRSDVVSGTPILFTGQCVEVFLDDLFSSRKSIAPVEELSQITEAVRIGRRPCGASWSPLLRHIGRK